MAKIEAILQKLIQLSNEGKIEWAPTVDPLKFSAALGSSSVVIAKDGHTFYLNLLNRSGDDLDHMDSGEWGNPSMEQLYDLARRRALNVDAELDNVLVELNQL